MQVRKGWFTFPMCRAYRMFSLVYAWHDAKRRSWAWAEHVETDFCVRFFSMDSSCK